MAAARCDNHVRQAEDYNEVPGISCDHGFFTDSKDDDRQLTDAEAIELVPHPDSGQEKQNSSCRRCALQRNQGLNLI